MEVVTTIAEARAAIRAARREGHIIGVVPTMGAFHEGHLSLMRRAKQECGFVVVTLFVNPTQFGPKEDLSRYPRDPEGDRAMAEGTGADLLFAPPVEEVYPSGFATYVTVEALTTGLCGASRPTHFRGVTTVVAKLFNMLQPDRAYFGEKDYQQLQVIRRMTRDLDLPVEIVPCAIVREADGLAMSSRNRYLSPEARESGLALSRGLAAACAAFAAGEVEASRLITAAREVLEVAPGLKVDYVELVDAESLVPVSVVTAPSLLAVAAFLGPTRLIDNTVLGGVQQLPG
ncbi:MAG: pantoate/beta-alanine ligase [Armatimonadetes bacterium]|nr:pantoate/beta-alanine ligase [Armatimonadota bacterium]